MAAEPGPGARPSSPAPSAAASKPGDSPAGGMTALERLRARNAAQASPQPAASLRPHAPIASPPRPTRTAPAPESPSLRPSPPAWPTSGPRTPLPAPATTTPGFTPRAPLRAPLSAAAPAASPRPGLRGPLAAPSRAPGPASRAAGPAAPGRAGLPEARTRAPLAPTGGLPLPTLRDIELTVDAAGYEAFSDAVRELLGFDLTQYKRPQVWRRANSFARQKGFDSLVDLVAECKTDLGLRTELRDMITINVSEFFRNPDAWETVRASALAELVRLGRPIRFWSAGCSLGYEPYTWAMLVSEAGGETRILATDLDETILSQARASAYAEFQMLGVSAARRARFFTQEGERWVAKPELQRLVQWRRQDLLRDAFPSDLDIIACRNVVIYFTDEAKDALYRRFVGALRPGGYLFIGATEAISDWRSFGLRMLSSGLYQRTDP